jgi:hypothetical protein
MLAPVRQAPPMSDKALCTNTLFRLSMPIDPKQQKEVG